MKCLIAIDEYLRRKKKPVTGKIDFKYNVNK